MKKSLWSSWKGWGYLTKTSYSSRCDQRLYVHRQERSSAKAQQ
jgi:hypothetical protein